MPSRRKGKGNFPPRRKEHMVYNREKAEEETRREPPADEKYKEHQRWVENQKKFKDGNKKLDKKVERERKKREMPKPTEKADKAIEKLAFKLDVAKRMQEIDQDSYNKTLDILKTIKSGEKISKKDLSGYEPVNLHAFKGGIYANDIFDPNGNVREDRKTQMLFSLVFNSLRNGTDVKFAWNEKSKNYSVYKKKTS